MTPTFRSVQINNNDLLVILWTSVDGDFDLALRSMAPIKILPIVSAAIIKMLQCDYKQHFSRD